MPDRYSGIPVQRLLLKLAILGEYGPPVDGKPAAIVHESPQGEPDETTPVTEGVAAPCSSEDSTADKVFMPTPWVKPPRRQSFNESATRGWRREYQREYRAEHGNG